MQYDMSDNFEATLTCSLETIIDCSFQDILISNCVLQPTLTKVRLRRENRSPVESGSSGIALIEKLSKGRTASAWNSVRDNSRYQI